MTTILHVNESDRRNILRVSQNATLAVYTSWPQHPPLLCRTRDLSLTGFRMLCPAKLKTKQILKLDSPVFRAIAEVTRVKASGEEYEVGGRFVTFHLERSRGAFLTRSV